MNPGTQENPATEAKPKEPAAPDCTRELISECGPALAVRFQRTMGLVAANELWAAIKKARTVDRYAASAATLVQRVLDFYLGPGMVHRRHKLPNRVIREIVKVGLPPQVQAARVREEQRRYPVPVTRAQRRGRRPRSRR